MVSRFGTMQTKLGIIRILRAFKIMRSSKTAIPIKFKPGSGFQIPLDGMWLKFEKLYSDF